MGFFSLHYRVQTYSGATQSTIQLVPGALTSGIKWPGREADHLPPSSSDIKNACSYTSIPSIRLHGMVLN